MHRCVQCDLCTWDTQERREHAGLGAEGGDMVLVIVCCCCADGIREKDKNMLGGVLKAVAVLNKDNSYSLAKHAWQDVRNDWPYYTDVDRQLLKKSVQQVLHFPSPAFSASPQCWFVSTLICSPEGRLGMYPPVWNLRAVI